MSDQQLAEELYKPIIRNFGKRKVHSPFIDKIWGADLADMQLVSKFYKGIFVFYNVWLAFIENLHVIPLKITKVLQLLMLLKKFKWIW